VLELINHTYLTGTIIEPCAGRGNIANPLREYFADKQMLPATVVYTNDIMLDCQCDYAYDARHPMMWRDIAQDLKAVRREIDWVVTNPPFKYAPAILDQAYRSAHLGVAMLLRLSFLEPCADRARFLAEHPPTELIILPRISFTGDGNTDSVTTAWMVWLKESAIQRQQHRDQCQRHQQRIIVRPRAA
jgi:hypothetical protein